MDCQLSAACYIHFRVGEGTALAHGSHESQNITKAAQTAKITSQLNMDHAL